ncbi:MAG: hypothetical protein RLZZ69_2571 [Cyanobacteriota bacterium]
MSLVKDKPTNPAPGWFARGNNPKDYDIGSDRQVPYTGKASGYIKNRAKKPEGFGTLMQSFSGKPYLNERIKLSAYIKSENVEDKAWLWLRVDGSCRRMLSFDNMHNRPINGTNDWQCYEVVLDVPQATVNIAFGVGLSGKGHVWVDKFQFEKVSLEVPTTNLLVDEPQNLDFDEVES